MVKVAYIGMIVFVVLLAGMSWTTGTQRSISALSKRWRWLLLVALWSQVMLLPAMLSVTPSRWQWLAAMGIGAIVITGAADVWNKTDERVHIIAAVMAFTLLTAWVMVVNSVCLLPLIVCIAAGRDNWQWRVEVGLVISVYMALVSALKIVIR